MSGSRTRYKAVNQLLTFVIIPMNLLIIAIVVTFIYINEDAAWVLSMLGTPGIFIFDLIYIVFFDSPKRWPGLTARQRAVKVMTFQR